MRLSFFIARKLYSSEGKTSRTSLPAIRIATIGVAVGLAVMIIAMGIALGFRNEITSKVIGFGTHMVVIDATSTLEQTGRPVVATDSLINELKSVPNVKHVQTFSLKPGLFKTENEFSGITLKGIDKEYDTSFIASHIIDGQMPDYASTNSANSIIISKNIADALKIKCGDKIFAYFFEDGMRTRRLTVSAIYRTDLSQFDNVIVYASRETVDKLNGYTDNQVSGLEITLHDFSTLYQTSLKVGKKLAYHNIDHNTQYLVYNIKDIYSQIFDWLDLLKINIAVILILMTLVAGVTIVSGLLILILERTSTIALLKSLGATNTLVRHTFINLALFILIKGMIIGNVAGLALAFIQKEFHIIKLDPASYYIDSVPVELNLTAILAINVATFIVSTLALVVPSYLAARIHPSKVLRFE